MSAPGPIVIIGAGPAGLTAAHELGRHGVVSDILERDPAVGGLSRTEVHKGYCFDIGGHRFFTKIQAVDRMWRDVLGDDFLRRKRLSRIYYRSRFFRYPVEPIDAMLGLGVFEAAFCLGSYLRARLSPPKTQKNLEDWLVAKFGRRLYGTFFQTYTEKVWGVSCREISADWAAQRIRGLSVTAVLKNALFGKSANGPKTLIEEFDYPSRGPGMMWERVRDRVVAQGSRVLLEHPVDRIEWKRGGVTAVVAGGRRFPAGPVISSMPIRELVERLDPAPPKWLREAGRKFRYRDFLTVALIVRGDRLFPDQWIYVHDPAVRAGRVQNYNNWSPHMAPHPGNTCLGFEYFCSEGDPLWGQTDGELVALATREMEQLGLAARDRVVEGVVVRARKAYPVYDDAYQDALCEVRRFLRDTPNLQLVGRNGMHRYNNQDHSMLTGMLAARNILGAGCFDLWRVNADSDYHEDGFRLTEEEIRGMDRAQPIVPRMVSAATAAPAVESSSE